MTDNTDTLSTYKKKAIANAQRAHSYGGKRFLGFTPKGAEVWVSMFVDRDTLNLKVNCTHDLNILLKKGSRLANRRVIVIVATLFGGLLGCLFAIINHFYRKR